MDKISVSDVGGLDGNPLNSAENTSNSGLEVSPTTKLNDPDHVLDKAIVTKPAKKFFDLPVEVRHNVYKLAFPKRKFHPQHHIKTFFHQNITANNASANNYRKTFKYPALSLAVSKAFEAEAAAALYGQSTFTFDTIYDCYYFVRSVGMVKGSYIKEIEIAHWDMRSVERSLQDMGLNQTIQQFLGQRCPTIHRLNFGGIKPDVSTRKWSLAMLEHLVAFFDALPSLSDTLRATRTPYELCLFTKGRDNDISWYHGIPFKPTFFDIYQAISEVKLEIQARKVAGIQKAQATKEANKAILAAGGAAADDLRATQAVRRAEEKRRADVRAARSSRS